MKVNSDKLTSDDAYTDACRFIIKLGTLVHGYGPNAIRLECYLSRLTAALGFRGVFRSTPTELNFAFSREGDSWQRTHIVNMPGTGLALAKLARVGELVDGVAAGQVDVGQATIRLTEIDRMPNPWSAGAIAASYAFCGSGFAVLLAGGWWDVIFAALFSLVVFGMVMLSTRGGVMTAEWLPLSTAFVAGTLAAAAKILVPEVNGVLVILSAILILIPGYAISVGIIELLSRRVVSGWANLTGGLVFLIKQSVGAWLGVAIVKVIWQIPTATPSPVNAQWLWLFMPLLIIGLCMVFQTALRDFFWAVLGCGIAYGGILLGSAIAGGNLGNLLGTIIAVVFANIWARNTGRPTSIVLLPAIVLLVSGSIGFRGLAAVAAGQVLTGEHQFIQMFVVGVTIAAGLLVGNTVVRPKATL